MKTLLKQKLISTIAVLFGLIGSLTYAQMDNPATLSVILENCSSAQGKVLVSVHNASTFYDQTPPFWAEKKAKTEVLSFTFKLSKNTSYAVMVLHDKNENYQMDFNQIGLPKEEAANSGKRNKYGRPLFELAKFELKKDRLMRLRF